MAYTAVLQGHLNLARMKFPRGTCGLALDAMARAPLWAKGLDYGHGTGHGIGAGLNVHEGPFGISGSSKRGDLLRKVRIFNSLNVDVAFFVTRSFCGLRIEKNILLFPLFLFVAERQRTLHGAGTDQRRVLHEQRTGVLQGRGLGDQDRVRHGLQGLEVGRRAREDVPRVREPHVGAHVQEADRRGAVDERREGVGELVPERVQGQVGAATRG